VLSGESQCSRRDKDSTDAGQQDIRTIQARGKAELAVQTAKAEDNVLVRWLRKTLRASILRLA